MAQGNYILKYTKGEAPAAVGSIDNPQTVTQAVAVINALAEGATTEADYYVAGKISRILTTDDNIAKFKNIDYYISDGTSEIQVFRGKNLDNTDFTAAGQINVGDEVIVLGKLMKYVNPNTGAVVPEMAQGNYIVKYTKGTASATGTPQGSGTLADPYNAAGANKFIKSLAADTESDNDVYIKGKIVKFANKGEFENSGTYGNSTFYISDDGKESSEQFYVFRTLYFGNVQWTSGVTPKVGDEVIICGKVIYYQGKTPETSGNKSYLYSLNGKTEGGGSDTPSSNLGTKDAPLTVAKALDAINALEDSGETGTEAYVKGKISQVQSFSDKYKSITYYISDDGTQTKELQIYSGKNIGGAEFASIDDLSVGDVVVVKGKLKKYMKNGEAIPEMNQPNEIITITKASGGGGETPSGNTGLEASFESGKGDFTIDDKSIGEGITYVWSEDTKNKYMKASAYKGGCIAAESWLISPAFSLKGITAPVMTFNNACNQVKEGTITDHIKVMIYDGANWAEATITNMPDGKSWTFVDSTVDLKSIAGKEGVKIAFKYVSTTAVAPTWEIKTVSIK